MRDLDDIDNKHFDIVVVGGGIQGCCVAREAVINGYSVALIDQSDFGSGTSHHSLKLIHGGVRYLQQFDIKRVLESVRERRFWLRAAPHLVRPLKVVVPTFGYGLRGRAAFALAMVLYNLLSWRRNLYVGTSNCIGLSYTLSKGETLSAIPGAPPQGVTGGAVWYDGQMTYADRVIWECIKYTKAFGGKCFNYVEGTSIQVEDCLLYTSPSPRDS